jgi:4-oxalomesaconate tautomerase
VSIRLDAGPLMNLGDVAAASVPKMTLVSPPTGAGDLNTRTFIPHRVHEAIGVLGAVSVATAAWLPGSPAATVLRPGADLTRIVCEHPTGVFTAAIDATLDDQGTLAVARAGIIRTARKLFDGIAFPRPE